MVGDVEEENEEDVNDDANVATDEETNASSHI